MPAVVKVNRYCRALAPTVHLPPAGVIDLPPAAYPPCAEISLPTDAQVERNPTNPAASAAEADARHKHIRNTPAPKVTVPLQMYFLARAKTCQLPAAIITFSLLKRCSSTGEP